MENFRFPATVKKHQLSTKKIKDEGGDDYYEVPCVTITLEYIDERARSINARLSAFQGEEVLLDLEGNGKQLHLG